jgi:hypothetical protein
VLHRSDVVADQKLDVTERGEVGGDHDLVADGRGGLQAALRRATCVVEQPDVGLDHRVDSFRHPPVLGIASLSGELARRAGMEQGALQAA